MTFERPLTIGEIFDHAVVIVVQKWRPLLVIFAILAVTETIFNVLSRDGTQLWVAAVVTVLSGVSSLLFCPAAIAFCASLPVSRELGALARFTLRLFWPSVVYTIVFFAACAVAVLLAAIPALLAALLGGPLVVVALVLSAIPAAVLFSVVMGYGSIAYANLVLESRGPFDAIGVAVRRSGTTGWMRVAILGAALSAATLGPLAGLEVIPDWLPGAVWIKAIGLAVFVAAIWIFSSAVETVAAIDDRNRACGADLSRALEATQPA